VAVGTKASVSVMSRTLVNVVGLFNGTVRELKEMLYESEAVRLDHSQFEAAFGNYATPLSEAIDTTLAWYRAHPQGAA